MDRKRKRLFQLHRLLILLDRLENLKFNPALGKIRGKHLNHRFDLSLMTLKSEFLNRRLECHDGVSSSLGQSAAVLVMVMVSDDDE